MKSRIIAALFCLKGHFYRLKAPFFSIPPSPTPKKNENTGEGIDKKRKERKR